MTYKKVFLAVIAMSLVALMLVTGGCSLATKPGEKILARGTVELQPGGATGPDVRVTKPGEVHGTFKNRFDGDIEMYVCPKAPDNIEFTDIHDIFADPIFSTTDREAEYEFTLPPEETYTIWFFNPSTSQEARVTYEAFWAEVKE